MVWLPDGEKISKISLFVLTSSTNVTDTQRNTHTADTAWRLLRFFLRYIRCQFNVPFLAGWVDVCHVRIALKRLDTVIDAMECE